MVMESKILLMEINIEGIINKENLMEKVNIFGQVEQLIKGNFIKDWEKEMEHGLVKEEINMRDHILLTVKTVLDSFDGQTVIFIVANFVRIWDKDVAKWNGTMTVAIKESGSAVFQMAKVSFYILSQECSRQRVTNHASACSKIMSLFDNQKFLYRILIIHCIQTV